MTVVNDPYIAIIVGVCSIVGRNLSLYGIIRMVKRVVAVVEEVCVAAMVEQWLWWRGVCGCDGGAMVWWRVCVRLQWWWVAVVERVNPAAM